MQTQSVRAMLIVAAVIVLGILTLFILGALRLPSASVTGPQPELTNTTAGAEIVLTLSAVTEEPPQTISAGTPEIGFNRNTSTPSNETPLPTTTIFINPTLFLTRFVPPTETATPLPLSGLGADIELSIVQLHLISSSQNATILAEVSNPTEQPLENVRLIFTTPDGLRVGGPVALNVSPLSGQSWPGASAELAASDPVIANWGSLQAHAVGTPPTAQPGEPGYPAVVAVAYPNVSHDQANLHYEVNVLNDTGTRIAIIAQNIAFYSGDGTLLLVVNLGAHDPVANGASYMLTGTLSLDQAASGGHTLADYVDVLVGISAEIAP